MNIEDVTTVEELRLLLEAGEDLNLAPDDVKREFMGLGNGGTFQVSEEDYRRHSSRIFGRQNPERQDHPFWREMIRLGVIAYTARKHFDPSEPLCGDDAVWCYSRFGSTVTQLEDGRFVQIAGEHEDHYDPDFCIYNDVVVHDGKGDFEIYGYPKAVFPPTDFHSATLVDDGVYIIGSLGYWKQRCPGRTPVYRLQLESWKIEAIHATGDAPGWLFRHRAAYCPERHVIGVDGGEIQVSDSQETVVNEGTFELDLSSLRWRRTS